MFEGFCMKKILCKKFLYEENFIFYIFLYELKFLKKLLWLKLFDTNDALCSKLSAEREVQERHDRLTSCFGFSEYKK